MRRYSLRALNRTGRILASGAMLVGLSQPLAAQRAVVFQHGLASSGDTWWQEATALQYEFQITPFRPTTTSSAVFFDASI